MKKTIFAIFAYILPITALNATVTFNTQFGQFLDSNSVNVPFGTLLALIVDSDNDGLIADTLTTDSNITSSSQGANFNGATIAQNNLVGGDLIFATATTNNDGGAGTWLDTVSGITGLESLSGRAWGIFWFPGETASGVTLGGSFEIGGINILSNPDPGTVGMIVPNDGANVFFGGTTASVGAGGSTPPSSFEAVLVPEPSAALLALLGTGALLMRRRR